MSTKSPAKKRRIDTTASEEVREFAARITMVLRGRGMSFAEAEQVVAEAGVHVSPASMRRWRASLRTETPLFSPKKNAG